MLVCRDRILGSIGGGQAEFMATEHAKNMTGCNIEEYNLNVTDSDEPGMICGGTIKVMFIPLEEEK